MLDRAEDTILYRSEIGDTEYEFEIAFILSDDCIGSSDEPVRGVEAWRVYKIDGYPNVLGEFWAEQLNDERVCDAIMEGNE